MKPHWLVVPWITLFVVTLALRLMVHLFPAIPGGRAAAVDEGRDRAVQAYLLHFEDAVLPLPLEERAHLADVHTLLGVAWCLLAVSGLVLVGSSLIAARSRSRRERLARTLEAGATLGVAILLAFGSWILLDFPGAFRAMHRLLFSADSWFFDDGTWLVERFPAPFWRNAALLMTGLTILLSGLMAILGRLERRLSVPDSARGK